MDKLLADLKKFMISIGVDDEQIEALSTVIKSDDDKKTFDFKDWNEKVVDYQKESFKNDSDFMKDVTHAEKRKQEEIHLRKAKQAFDLVNDDTAKEKTYEEILQIGKKKFEKSSTATNQELQDTINTLEEKIGKYDSEIIPNIKSQVELEKNNLYRRTKLSAKLSTKEILGKPNAIIDGLERHLDDNYKLKYEDGELVVTTKDDLKIKKADGGFHDVDSLIDLYIEKNDLKKVSNTGVNQKVIEKKAGEQDYNRDKSHHLSEAEKFNENQKLEK